MATSDSSFIFHFVAFFLFLFCFLGAFDGLYFHIYKFKLHLHRESRMEHHVHGARAFLLCGMAYLLFAENTQGLLLYLGVFLLVADFGLEIIDVLIEKESRANLGGISSVESLLHIAATSSRCLAVGVLLLFKPAIAWSLNAPLFAAQTYTLDLRLTGFALAIGSGLGALHHIFFLSQRLNSSAISPNVSSGLYPISSSSSHQHPAAASQETPPTLQKVLEMARP